MMVMAGSLVTITVGVLAFSLLNYNRFTDKYTTAMTTAATGSIYDLSRAKKVSSPQAYSSIIEAGDEIRAVYYSNSNDSNGNPVYEQIYDYKGATEEKLVWLMSAGQTRVNVKVELKQTEDNIPPYLEVYLKEVGD